MLLKDIIERLKPVDFLGNADQGISDIIQLDESNTRHDVISWANDLNLQKISKAIAGSFICSALVREQKINPECNYIIVKNPRASFRELLKLFAEKKNIPLNTIKPTAVIHASVDMGDNVAIGHYVIIEENCIIGNDTEIGANTVIHAGTHIGAHVKIGCNNTIGGVGFGYELNDDKQYELLPHLGNVVIEDEVEVGNNTCIDRAVIGSTLIKKNAKIDNLVHIAHGVEIGSNSLVIAHAMIAGSTKVGDNCWIAPSTAIMNSLTIAANSTIGMGAVILKNVDEGQTVVGNPGKVLNQ